MTQETTVTPHGYRGWLLVVGMLLSVAGGVYLSFYVRRHWSELPAVHLSWSDVGWLLAACGLYFLTLLTTAAAWLCALRALGASMPAVPALGVALAAQIGKYAPGNVAQHIGRAALAAARGVNVMTTAKASLMEIAMAVCASVLVAVVSGGMSPDVLVMLRRLPFRPGALVAMLAVAAVILFVGANGVSRWLKQTRREPRWNRAFFAGGLRMLGCYVLGFLFAGLSYYATTRAFGGRPDPALCIAVYALAWVVGFITPGAPAGLGVRESILVLATSRALGPAAVSIAIAHRLVTAITDAAGAGAGALALSHREARR